MATRRTTPKSPRSKKAGSPPAPTASSPQAARRAKTAHAAFRKDTTIHEAADGPRVVWGVTKPKVKKR
jgi:hypothetical protein